MVRLLAKLFIKNHTDVKDAAVRGKYGVLCGAVGIFLNVLLFALKMLAGVLSRSVAITADAFNNLSDAAASVVTIIAFKMSGKKPDDDHPFGHGRIEYIAGLVVSFLILMMGFELLKSSVQAVITPQPLDTNIIAIAILAVSILVKLYMYLYNHAVGKKICSATMEAAAKDSLNDTISTAVVLVTVVLVRFFPGMTIPLDGIAGIFVAIFILHGGYESVKDTVNPLLGVPADREFVEQVESTVLSHEPICGIHDLIVHDYGPGRLMVSLHAEVPGDINIFDLHDVVDNAEKEVSERFGCLATIHMDPVDTKNPELAVIKEFITGAANELGEGFSVHDVRMVPGTSHTNIIFDVVRPHKCQLTDTAILSFFSERLRAHNERYNCVVQIDNPFV